MAPGGRAPSLPRGRLHEGSLAGYINGRQVGGVIHPLPIKKKINMMKRKGR